MPKIPRPQSRLQKATKAPATKKNKPPFTLEFYRESGGIEPVRAWLKGLSLTKRQIVGTAMREILQVLGVDVCDSKWGKQLGEGLFEFRIRMEESEVSDRLPPEKILIRAFCHAHGAKMVLLLAGYDKAEDPSKKRQNKEIEEARRRLRDWRQRHRG